MSGGMASLSITAMSSIDGSKSEHVLQISCVELKPRKSDFATVLEVYDF